MTAPPRSLTVRTGVLAAALLLTVTGCGAEAAPRSAPAASAPVDVSVSDCGSTWHPGPAGEQDLTLHNADYRPGEVRLVGRDRRNRGEVFADVEPFGPGTEVTIHPALAAGRYALQCLMQDEGVVTGPPVAVTGHGRGGPGVVPVDENQLLHATKAYTRWVTDRLPGLLRDTARMRDRLLVHDRAGARTAWVRAHADYQRLGAAYDAFGPLDARVNGLPPGGRAAGSHDPRWSGFHRIEQGVWHGAPYAVLDRSSAGLLHAVRALRHQLATTQLDPMTLSIRAHEISEDLLQTTLTGADDFGSHSALATVAAGLDGTHVVLGLLDPLLRSRYPQLPALLRRLAADRRMVATLGRTRLAHLPVPAWPRRSRERVDAAIDDLCERLAPVATMLEPRRTS